MCLYMLSAVSVLYFLQMGSRIPLKFFLLIDSLKGFDIFFPMSLHVFSFVESENFFRVPPTTDNKISQHLTSQY